MKPSNRYERFEPITLRALQRVLRQAEEVGMTSWELSDYLRELAALDRFAGPGAYPALRRMARRRGAGIRLRRPAAQAPLPELLQPELRRAS